MAPTIVRMGGGLITDKVKIKGNTVYMHDKAPLATAIWNDALDPGGGHLNVADGEVPIF